MLVGVEVNPVDQEKIRRLLLQEPHCRKRACTIVHPLLRKGRFVVADLVSQAWGNSLDCHAQHVHAAAVPSLKVIATLQPAALQATAVAIQYLRWPSDDFVL